jgi:hypothetical protein
MSAPYTNLRGKAEDVFFNYFQSTEGFSIPVYRAAEVVAKNTEITIPCVSVICTGTSSAMPEVDARAAVQNRLCSVQIIVISDTAQTYDGFTVRDYHDMLTGQVMDMLYDSALVEKLNLTGAGIGVGIVQVDTPEQSFNVRGNNYETTLTLTVNAYPKIN